MLEHRVESHEAPVVGARLTAALLRDALARRDGQRVSLAVSGGAGPWPMLAALAATPLEWSRVDLYQVDERVAPAGHDDRNLTHLRRVFTAPVRWLPMPVEADDLDAAARSYASSLPDVLDVVHLGLGPDGHTASLVPGDPVLEVRDRRVAVTGPYQGRRRMTMTYPTLDAAHALVWYVTGSGKDAALRQLRDGDASVPAGRVARSRAVLVSDR
jgi:6-phosphogluconolactonase